MQIESNYLVIALPAIAAAVWKLSLERGFVNSYLSVGTQKNVVATRYKQKMSFHHEIAFRKLILGEAERKRNKTWLDFY